jgi:two-component system NtrC family sensor kinase
MTPWSQSAPLWKRIGYSLSAKLIVLLVAWVVATFALLGAVNIDLHRRDLETATLNSAERISDVIKRSTSYYMLRNDREALYQMMRTMADEPGVVRIRVFNQEGTVSYSTDPAEVGHGVDKSAEACYKCHAQAQPLARLDRPDRFRIYRQAGERVLGIITPIENQPSCAGAGCHLPPSQQKILGVLDANLSLQKADASIAAGRRMMILYTVIAVLLLAFVAGAVIWELVHHRIKVLKQGTERIARGELGFQIVDRHNDEVGDLAVSFNRMSSELKDAREEITSWARTLEMRVEQKTRELKKAHEHVLHVEKMASVGKLAAVVAHEINNPLSGILTYAKLLRRWVEKLECDDTRRQEMRSSLELIESESRRCGEIVRNLLMFARTSPINLEWTNLNLVAERSVKLVQHQLELANIQMHLELDPGLSETHCDPSQVEQVILTLLMNAIDAMPRGGNLWLITRDCSESEQAQILVRDDGIGIPPENLPHLFEPFFTTKESGRGIGLGLAIARGVVERHGGHIEVASDPGRGTTFTVTLPLETPVLATGADD